MTESGLEYQYRVFQFCCWPLKQVLRCDMVAKRLWVVLTIGYHQHSNEETADDLSKGKHVGVNRMRQKTNPEKQDR